MDPTGFLYGWLGTRKYPAATYDCQQYLTLNGELRFSCKVRVKSFKFIGFGDGTTKKEAMTSAAETFCHYLIKNGHMAWKEFKQKQISHGRAASASAHTATAIPRRRRDPDYVNEPDIVPWPHPDYPRSGDHVHQGHYSRSYPVPDVAVSLEPHRNEQEQAMDDTPIGAACAQRNVPKITAVYSHVSLPEETEDAAAGMDENAAAQEMEVDDEPLTVRKILEIAVSAADLCDSEVAQRAILSEDVNTICELVQQARRGCEDELFTLSDELKELTKNERKLQDECRQLQEENEGLKKLLEAQDEK